MDVRNIYKYMPPEYHRRQSQACQHLKAIQRTLNEPPAAVQYPIPRFQMGSDFKVFQSSDEAAFLLERLKNWNERHKLKETATDSAFIVKRL